MKMKKVLSAIVAGAMAASVLTAMSAFSASAKTTDNLLDETVNIKTWSDSYTLDLSSYSLPRTGSAYVTVSGSVIDSSTYSSVKVSNSSWEGLYEDGASGNFSFDIALSGDSAEGGSLNFQGYNVSYTSVVLHTVDDPINVVKRGYQEATTGASGTNDKDIFDSVNLAWDGTDGDVTADALSSLRFDGTESLVVKGTGTGNVKIVTSDWSSTLSDGGIWTSGDTLSIPITSDFKGGAIVTGTLKNCSVSVVDNGSKSVRYILEVSQEDLENVKSASITIRKSDNTTTTVSTSKAYKSINANGSKISAGTGNAFVTFTITGVPGNFEFSDAVVSFDGVRVATITK
jgi:hypothetical protein